MLVVSLIISKQAGPRWPSLLNEELLRIVPLLASSHYHSFGAMPQPYRDNPFLDGSDSRGLSYVSILYVFRRFPGSSRSFTCALLGISSCDNLEHFNLQFPV